MAATGPPMAPTQYDVILGPILLGNLFEWGLFGILGLQTYFYFIWFPHDPHFIKLLVAIIFALDTLHTAVCAYTTWVMLVSGWGNPEVLFITPWSLCMAVILTGIISATVQLFFAHRAWMLGKSVAVTSIIIAISLTQCISAFEGAIQVWLSPPADSKLLAKFRAFALWLSSSLACDIVIATSMVYFLIRTKPKPSLQVADALITRLISNSVQSGTVTAVCAGIDLILFLTFRTNNLHDVAFFMLSKLFVPCFATLWHHVSDQKTNDTPSYSNTLLANLNARRSLHSTGNIETASTGAVLSDPQVVSLGLWPDPSPRGSSRGIEGLSAQSEPAHDQASSADETDVPTPNLTTSKNLGQVIFHDDHDHL